MKRRASNYQIICLLIAAVFVSSCAFIRAAPPEYLAQLQRNPFQSALLQKITSQDQIWCLSELKRTRDNAKKENLVWILGLTRATNAVPYLTNALCSPPTSALSIRDFYIYRVMIDGVAFIAIKDPPAFRFLTNGATQTFWKNKGWDAKRFNEVDAVAALSDFSVMGLGFLDPASSESIFGRLRNLSADELKAIGVDSGAVCDGVFNATLQRQKGLTYFIDNLLNDSEKTVAEYGRWYRSAAGDEWGRWHRKIEGLPEPKPRKGSE